MGEYLDVSDVRARLDRTVSVLYDHDGAVDEAWLAADLAAVEGVLNAHLGMRYALPLSDAGAVGLWRGLALDLFLELAYRRLPSGAVPPAVQAAADRARELLGRVARGELSPGTSSAPTPPPAVRGSLITGGNAPQMTRARLAGF